MDKELLEQFQLLSQGMVQMEQRLSQEIKDVEKRMEEKLELRIKESEARTAILIENKVTKRIDALVDGYQTVHEKQWQLERTTERMRGQIEDLQNRVAALENRPA